MPAPRAQVVVGNREGDAGRRGPRRVNESTREEMRKILGEIQDGSFTRELVEEFDAGKPNFLKRREAEQSEQIEQVGARLRPLMSWLSNED